MGSLPMSLLRQACRIFLEHSYAADLGRMPVKIRNYFELTGHEPSAEFLPPAPAAVGVCRQLNPGKNDGLLGYELRLGSCEFRHLKLRIQRLEHQDGFVWVFTVDTHDAFSRTNPHPPPDHPDCVTWLAMQQRNLELKNGIEHAFEQVGLATFNSLLEAQIELKPPAAPRG